MQKLNRDMLSRYEIPIRDNGAPVVAQFGSDARLLSVADKLLEEAGLSIACVPSVHGAFLKEQEGLFTLLIRGFHGEDAIREERVIQAVKVVSDDISGIATLTVGLVDTDSASAADAARFLRLRYEKGLKGLRWICIGEHPDCAKVFGEGIGEGEFGEWIRRENAFYPAMLEGMAYRGDAKEAAQLCESGNYADSMLHLAEPFARLTIQADAFLPIPSTEGIVFTDNIARDMLMKQRVFDAGLFLAAAPGWLAGHSTLHDCMSDEAMRKFIGEAFLKEILPALPVPKETAAPYIISAFERYENSLQENRLLEAGSDLLGKFRRGVLSVLETSEEAPLLTYALACTIMLLAGARPDQENIWTVLRGKEAEVIHEDRDALEAFGTLAHDMPPESLAYAVLADRTLWGEDLREIIGLEEEITLDLAAIQRGE